MCFWFQLELEIRKHITARGQRAGTGRGGGERRESSNTNHSNPKVMMVWTKVTMANDHVQSELGRYILRCGGWGGTLV